MVAGGGAVGLAIAKEISAYLGPDKVCLIEKAESFGDGQSGRSSEVLHAGLYYPPNSLTAKLCIEGKELIRTLCKENGVKVLNCGKLVVARDEEENSTLEDLMENARASGIKDSRIIGNKDIKKLERNVSAYSAILSPSTAIFDSASYLGLLSRINQSNGTIIRKGTEVIEVEPNMNGIDVLLKNKNGLEKVSTKYFINSAGLYAGELAKKINPNFDIETECVKGGYAIFPNLGRLETKMNIYQAPIKVEMENFNHYKLRTHLTSTVDEKLIRLGPIMKPTGSSCDYSHNSTLNEHFSKVSDIFRNLQLTDLRHGDAGIMTLRKDRGDFHIMSDEVFPHCINLVGIASPGLTSSLAIGNYVQKLFEKLNH